MSKGASSSSCTSSSLSSDEEVDVRDLKPIKEYLSDRRELARQLFKSVKTEKIQMMLPQTLKKMDLGQLEKWCANELSGMSKSRILCILNGKPMLESSDTSESDDSGPSLEIISDTEEWFTDEDMSKKEESSKMLKGKIKKERIKQKGKSQFHKKNDNKSIHKKVPDTTYKNLQFKKEDDIEKAKEKEGDSLLDLLELEMRARAIRALIRKEEDIIPNTSKSVASNDTSNENAVTKAEQDEIKEKENCRRQLERIISAQQNSTVEDEDVVLVVQPTPTIELLSSDSEGESHSGVRVNKKLQNERVMEAKGNINHIENRDLNDVHTVNNIENLKENKMTKNSTETHKEIDSTHKNEVFKRNYSNNVSHKDGQSKSGSKRRKTKKKSHIKEQTKSIISEVDTQCTKSSNVSQTTKDTKNIDCLSSNSEMNEKEPEDTVKSKMVDDSSSSNKQSLIEVSSISSKAGLDEEKSIDLDEIIDLDDYCDDMDDTENSENDKDDKIVENKQCKLQMEVVNSPQKSNGTETWASRYYQTDDVQNVIKESKIQSEIRKRLRERQRLSKLSTSPSKNSPSLSPVIETASNKVTEKHPMGSVDEYLALKHTAVISLGTPNSSDLTLKDNAASTNTHTNTSRLIEYDRISDEHYKNQKIDKEFNVSDNANETDINAAKNEKLVGAINVMNSV
ncbi:PREDICTED: eisosome protein SEG2-like [Eufriesea mexicana]|uniref:eisosome protein SEG2-like n=1 Tax=Eufriesea mexicana TaxID=516756 RepID=UPI00083BE5A3|nr:PREDICTED: eisosome protein SEG2-like [Eufriesea mexicana]